MNLLCFRGNVNLTLVSSILLCLLLGSDEVDSAGNNYYVYVAAESDDTVDVVRFGPAGGELLKRIPVGRLPTEIEGPHGVRVSPNGRHWFVSVAHGFPYGRVYKYTTGDDSVVGNVEVGFFPATMDVSPTTGFLFVANFNLHGDHEPSSVSVIDTVSMSEIAQIKQGVMPHGSRLSPDGATSYSVAMMSDTLYEIDALTLKLGRTLLLDKEDGGVDGRMGMSRPTWVQPHPQKPMVYVALNGIDQVVEVDLQQWAITRRFDTQKGPYNLAISPDGRLLIVTCKSDNSIAFWDLVSGKELANVPSVRRIPHGVTVSPDGQLAFVTVEGVGGDPGSVEVLDLRTFRRLAVIDVGKQASGIDFWKIGP